LKVPVGTGTAVEEQLSISASMRLASLDWYTARQGDTLALVAKKLGVAKTDLAAANDLASSARLIAGQKLIVPREAKAQTAARTAAQTSAPAVDLSNASLSKVSYQVKPGDTLSSIARVFSTNVTALMDWNHLTSSAIREGARLTIYTAIHAN
jgi:LysM repeat protein